MSDIEKFEAALKVLQDFGGKKSLKFEEIYKLCDKIKSDSIKDAKK